MSDAEVQYAEELIVSTFEARLRAALTAAGDRVFTELDRALDPSESPAIAVCWKDLVTSYDEGGQGIGTRLMTEEHVLEIHSVVIAKPAEFERRSMALAAQVRIAMADPSIEDALPVLDLRLHRRTRFRAAEAETLIHGGDIHLYVLTTRTREDAPDTLI